MRLTGLTETRQLILVTVLVGLSISIRLHAQADRFQGQWRAEQPDQGVVVSLTIDSPGAVVVPGQTKGHVEPLTMTLRDTRRNGDVMTFSTDLPDNEGSVEWEFRITTADSAVLRAVKVEGEALGDDAPTWTLRRG